MSTLDATQKKILGIGLLALVIVVTYSAFSGDSGGRKNTRRGADAETMAPKSPDAEKKSTDGKSGSKDKKASTYDQAIAAAESALKKAEVMSEGDYSKMRKRNPRRELPETLAEYAAQKRQALEELKATPREEWKPKGPKPKGKGKNSQDSGDTGEKNAEAAQTEPAKEPAAEETKAAE